jgi:MFS family permease
MLIAGRGIQGAGAGGISVISNVILSDLVSQKERGYYMAILVSVYCVGTSLGPFLGGAIAQSKSVSWRWIFYLNLPFGGVALVCLYLFLRVKWNRTGNTLSKLGRIDYAGIMALSISTIAILVAITWADVVYSWSSLHVLIPLVAGMLGLVGFCYYEHFYASHPVMPTRLFNNRTALIVNALSFINAVLVFGTIFFVPLYFQAVKLSDPALSGLQCLPLTLVALPGAAFAGIVLSKWGHYRWLHISGFALFITGFGLLSTLDQSTSTAAWVAFLAVVALGSGMLGDTTLPVFQATLVSEKDQAAATAAWSFIRSFGSVWGFAIASAVFNSYSREFSDLVQDPTARALLLDGRAYASGTKALIESFEEPIRQQLRSAFTLAIEKLFLVCIVFPGLAFVLAFFEKHLELKEKVESEFGLEDRHDPKDEDMRS